ncbi:MAG: DNA primase catalytic subunit PriS, partial [Candidatus Altiarchaeota archaeon]
MNVDTKVFVRKKIKDYYWRARVAAPSQVQMREFGVGTLEDKIKVRHKKFSSERELSNFLKRDAPSYISYSAALYEFPENQPMEAKNWLGADLVFDLDAPMRFFDATVFDSVKEETLNLLEFIYDDFGFAEKDVNVNFSGSKGYHIHIASDEVKWLSGDARREIVDYVTGSGLDLKYFMQEVEVDGFSPDRSGEYRKSAGARLGPTAGDVGWAGRIYGTVHDFLSKPESFRDVKGVGPKTVKKLEKDRERNLASVESGNWQGILDVREHLMQRVVDNRAVQLMGDTDKMVTIDTSRLMRLPDTIHGGSGLLAARVKDIDKFNPLVDAVIFSANEVPVILNEDIPEFDLMG